MTNFILFQCRLWRESSTLKKYICSIFEARARVKSAPDQNKIIKLQNNYRAIFTTKSYWILIGKQPFLSIWGLRFYQIWGLTRHYSICKFRMIQKAVIIGCEKRIRWHSSASILGASCLPRAAALLPFALQ